MTIISVILFVLSASLDTFIVSLAYGAKKINIGFLSNFIISLISSSGTFLSMFLGYKLINIMSLTVSNLFGTIVLLILGVYFILDYKKSQNSKTLEHLYENKPSSAKAILTFPEIVDIDKSGSIDLKEAIILSLALTLNNFALGLAASVTGLDITITTIFTFIFSFILIPLGMLASKKIKNKIFSEKCSLISGIIIIFLALIEVFI
ncbi:MAG: sporulation membrane protein YtaF [Sarcina sp.]